jgi:hypothetical protein
VLVIRCTRKLLDKAGPPVADPPPSTTLLGDWYAKPFGIAERRYVVLASAATRIAVLMPGRDLRNLARSFPAALAVQLDRLGVPPAAAERELEASREAVLAVTADRSMEVVQLRRRAVAVAAAIATASPQDVRRWRMSMSRKRGVSCGRGGPCA